MSTFSGQALRVGYTELPKWIMKWCAGNSRTGYTRYWETEKSSV